MRPFQAPFLIRGKYFFESYGTYSISSLPKTHIFYLTIQRWYYPKNHVISYGDLVS